MPGNKRTFVTVAILFFLLALVAFQIHSSGKFDWHTFWTQTAGVNWWKILLAVALIYFDYGLRALRWAIFLRPMKKDVSAWRLVPSQMIGFTGLALLGRPGEFIRPYLVAKREGLTFSSQLAVWMVERIFDMGGFGLLLAINIIVAPTLKDLPYYSEFRWSAFVLLALVLLAGAFTYAIWSNGAWIAGISERILKPFSPALGKSIAGKIASFGDGLHTIHDGGSFVALLLLSIAIWAVIAVAYWLVAAAYPPPLHGLTVSHVVLLMGFSVVGSIVALPAVGGGSQLATIKAMTAVFGFPAELAVSCGIMLWLATFASIAPAGLILAHMEHLSLTKLSEESEVEALSGTP